MIMGPSYNHATAVRPSPDRDSITRWGGGQRRIYKYGTLFNKSPYGTDGRLLLTAKFEVT